MTPIQEIFVLGNLLALVAVFILMSKVYGKTDSILCFAFATLCGVWAESAGLATGLYEYGRIFFIPFGATAVPLAIALAWPWVLGASLLLSDYITKGPFNRFLVAPLIAVAIDFVWFEPVAMHWGLWDWTNPTIAGWVAPWYNYLGWYLVALGTMFLWYLFSSERAQKAEAEHVYTMQRLG